MRWTSKSIAFSEYIFVYRTVDAHPNDYNSVECIEDIGVCLCLYLVRNFFVGWIVDRYEGDGGTNFFPVAFYH